MSIVISSCMGCYHNYWLCCLRAANRCMTPDTYSIGGTHLAYKEGKTPAEPLGYSAFHCIPTKTQSLLSSVVLLWLQSELTKSPLSGYTLLRTCFYFTAISLHLWSQKLTDLTCSLQSSVKSIIPIIQIIITVNNTSIVNLISVIIHLHS